MVEKGLHFLTRMKFISAFVTEKLKKIFASKHTQAYLMYLRMCFGVAWGTGRSIIVLKPGSELMTCGIMFAVMAMVA